MSYEPDVHPGDPASVRELPGLTIRKLSVSAMNNNVYLLSCTATGEQLLIDAADDAPRVLALVAAGGDGLGHVVTTPQHWDHHRALPAVLTETGARSYAGADDASGLPVAPDVLLSQGDSIRFGEVGLDVVHLRGHTPGSVALAYADPSGHVHLFTGDALFPGGVGNTKNPGQSFDALYADVVARVFEVYDDDTWVYPGHGSDTTLGAERPHLAEWRARGW
jgi:glyoxylase-like metal-dependent hydrolase (beta-lactamase superfamily II)